MMKYLHLLFLFFTTANISAADITILFDFEPKFEDVQRILDSNKLLKKRKKDIRIFFLGDLLKEFRLSDYTEGVEWNFESPSCDFIEKADLKNFIEKNGFDEIYYKEGKEILNDIGYLRNASDLVYLSKDVVKSKKNILILNLVAPKYPFVSDFNITVPEGDYYIGDFVEAKIDFFDKNKFVDCEISWSVNGSTLKSSAESVRIKLNSEKNEIACVISYQGSSCNKTKRINVGASYCTNKVPYELMTEDVYFTQLGFLQDDDTRFVQLANLSNLGEVYPASIWILPIIFHCPIREFEIELLDVGGNRLNKNLNDVQFGNKGTRYYSLDMIYDSKDPDQRTFSELGHLYYEKITKQTRKSENLELVLINGLNMQLKSKEIYFRLVPKYGNYNSSSLPKYKISFNSCSEN